ncbi:helix-turn-helix domain-containing protein [Nostoc sp.]|uniref:helix-turn-helix domain-containing protein n=1 Tax=Nostoc sp. TaxID=1180 RepID=UPI002FF62C23
MARPFNLEISESAEYLSKSLKKARTAFEKERLLLLWWIKTGQVTQHQELSRILGRDGSTVTRWLQKYRQGGLGKLLEVKTALLCNLQDYTRNAIAVGGKTVISPRIR